jgi:hypothetical protein
MDNPPNEQSNVILLRADMPSVHDTIQRSSIRIPLGKVEAARHVLVQIEAACALGIATLDKAPAYGDAAALRGVAQVFSALGALLAEAPPNRKGSIRPPISEQPREGRDGRNSCVAAA